MSFLGKEYVHEKSENTEGLLNSLPELTEENKQMLLKVNPSVKLVKNGDEYTFTQTYAPGHVTETKFKSGVAFDEKIREHAAKTTITVDGNVMTTVQTFGDKFTFNYKREFTDDRLVTTVTTNNWDGVCKGYFKAV